MIKMTDLQRIYHWSGCIVFALLIVFDFITLPFPSVGKVGVLFWIVSYLYILAFVLQCAWEIIQKSIQGKGLLTCIFILFYVVLVGINISDIRSLSGETTQEIACALNHFNNSNDWGYKGTCLFGYPARQYFLPSLPSFLLGRQLELLQIGGSLYFLTGIIIFASSILRYYRYSDFGDFISGLLLVSFSHIHYVNQFLFFFEQSIFPFSFGLILVGFYIHFLSDNKSIPLYLVGFLLLYLIFSYTPSLALYLFACAAILNIVVKRKIQNSLRIILFFLIILTLPSLISSFQFREDIHIFAPNEQNLQTLITDVQQSFQQILIGKVYETPYFSPIYSVIFLLVILSSLLLFFGWQYAFIALWILAVMILAVVAKGYSYYMIDFRIHRANIVFPVLSAAIALLMRKIEVTVNPRLLGVLLIIYFLVGAFFQQNYLQSRKPNEHILFIDWTKQNVPYSSNSMSIDQIVFASDSQNIFASLGDELIYFLPEFTHRRVDKDIFNQDCTLNGDYHGIIGLDDTHPCYSIFYQAEKLDGYKWYGIYHSIDKIPFFIMATE